MAGVRFCGERCQSLSTQVREFADGLMHHIKQRSLQWPLFPLALLYAATASAGWQQDWNETGPAFAAGVHDSLQLVSADDGSALIGFSDGYELRVTRVRGDASIAWHVAIPLSESTSSGLVPEPDGAALLTMSGTSSASVARFDEAGVLQWSSALQGKRFAVGADRIAAVLVLPDAGTIVTAMDRHTGRLLWQQRVPALNGGPQSPGPLAVDSAGNTYVTGHSDAGEPLLVKLDPQGHEQWRVTVEAPGALTVRDGRVYVAESSALQTLNAADGQSLWRKEGCRIDGGQSFVAGDPLCATGIEISRLAAASGAEVWRRSTSGGVLGVFDGNVYIGSDPVSFPPADAVLQRLSGSNGAPQWQQSLSFPVQGRLWQVSDSLIGIAGPGRTPDVASLYLYRLQDGSLSESRAFAEVPRGVRHAGEIRDGADLFVLSEVPWRTLPSRVRRLSAASGHVLWENAATQRDRYPGIALTQNRLLLAEQTNSGNAVVRSLDRVGGQLRWERSIVDAPVYSSNGKQPRIVGLVDDDALVSFGHGNYDSPTPSRRVQELQRLDDAAGTVPWKRQIAEWHDPSFVTPWTEPALLGIGEDALLWPAGGVTGPLTMGLQRRAGSDGALNFAMPAVPYSQTVRLSVAGDALFAATQSDPETLCVIKHSASTGVLLWQFDYPRTPWRYAQILDLLPLADGDVMVLVLLYQPTDAGGQSTHLLRVKGDGSGLRYVYQTLSLRKVRDTIGRIVLGASGEALLQRSLDQDRRRIDFLQRFDLEQGRVIGSQALALRGVDPFVQRTAWGDTFEPYGDDLLISGTVLRSPLPLTRRDALLDIAVAQRGDLALQLPAFPAGIAVGDSVPFAIGVDYAGDAAIEDATLVIELPWQGSESGLTCGGEGVGRCEQQVRHGQIVVHFDAAPGAQLEVHGSVRRLAAPTLDKSVLRAMVHGPIGLLESEVSNNFGSIAVDAPIFADGFDG